MDGQVPATPRPEGSVVPECAAAHLFGIVWATMSDVLGPPATATLFRRSLKLAAPRSNELSGVEIRRVGFEHSYRLPATWSDGGHEPMEALRAVAAELSPLLAELTGPTILRRLRAHPDLQRCRIIFPEDP
jgi:hypothetical protein